MGNLANKKITVSEYFEIERNSLEKHEYYEGELFAMAGAKKKHNLIVSNLIISIGSQFKGRPCAVYPSDMKVAVDKWVLSESDESGIIKLASIECVLLLDDIYDKVEILEDENR